MRLPFKFLPFCLIFSLSILFPASESLYSQEEKPRRVGPPPWTKANSPEFHPDGTISFRIWAPKAGKVDLESAIPGGWPSSICSVDIQGVNHLLN